MIYSNKTKDECITSCDCGCGSGILWQATLWDDEKCLVSLIEPSFYARQTGKVKPYFKRLWKALRGKEHYLTELVMTRSEAMEFSEFLRTLVSGGEHND